MNILIIDDSELSLQAMETTLKAHGHRVVCTSSPIGATRLILNEKIDVVVVDVNLPSMRGDSLAALFRKQPRMQHVGVVLVSGVEPEELKRLTDESKADAMCNKQDVREGLHPAVMTARRARK
ncbi:MAG: response regulator [Myxococcales bacterium]